MKNSDQPISRARDDVLGRASFALALARAIDQIELAKDGFVIGIAGESGSGKSSVVEMVLRYLKHIEMERFIPQLHLFREHRANGYLNTIDDCADAFDLIEDRINQLQASDLSLSHANYAYRKQLFHEWLDDSTTEENADAYWQLNEAYGASQRTIHVRFLPWSIAGRAELATARMSELARALQGHGIEINKAFASLLERLADLAPIAGAGIDLTTGTGIGRLVGLSGSWSAKMAAKLSTGPTLEQLRENVRIALRKLKNQRLLVVIDDLDRLTPHEAVEMVSLVKSLGDLPNVIYVLSFDYKNLTELFSKGTQLSGSEYLQKIIQYMVHLPPILEGGLSRILDLELSELLGDLDDSDQKRIGQTWHYILKYYLRTPRDVRVYCNSLAVALASQKDYVDPIDMMLLEILRLYEHEVYQWLRWNLDEITE